MRSTVAFMAMLVVAQGCAGKGSRGDDGWGGDLPRDLPADRLDQPDAGPGDEQRGDTSHERSVEQWVEPETTDEAGVETDEQGADETGDPADWSAEAPDGSEAFDTAEVPDSSEMAADFPYDFPGEEGEGSFTCKGYFECAQACGTPPAAACIQACRAGLSPEGLARVDWLEGCLEEHGCNDAATQEEVNECITESCLEPYFSCFSGPAPTCVDLAKCLDGCAAPDCEAACHDGMPPWVEDEWKALENCQAMSCPACAASPDSSTCATCAAEKCASEAGKCLAKGTRTCGETLACIRSCGQDSPCAQGCIDEGTFEAQDLVIALLDCLSTACQEYEGDETAWLACAGEASLGVCKVAADQCRADT